MSVSLLGHGSMVAVTMLMHGVDAVFDVFVISRALEHGGDNDLALFRHLPRGRRKSAMVVFETPG